MMPYGSKHRANKNLKEIITKVDFPALVTETHPVIGGKTLCPFHDDGKPSCHIYDNHFFCFSCGAKGDALTWLERVADLSKARAINELERRSGTKSSKVSRSSKVGKSQMLITICASEPLPRNVVNLHLKRARRLECVPLSLAGRGFTLEDLHRYKVASENEDALVPVFNPHGSMVAIKKRRHTIEAREQRYVYLTAGCGAPPWCSPKFLDCDKVLIVEGELNAAICASVYPEIAYMGVAGTENHLWPNTLKDKTVYVYADGDAPGMKARDRWALAACNAGAKKVLTLEPWEMDACDVAGKYGRDALRERLR
jgi:hypothetical protein